MSATQRFCRGCNTRYTPGLLLCPNCGRRDEDNSWDHEIDPVEAALEPQEQPEPEPAGEKTPEPVKAPPRGRKQA